MSSAGGGPIVARACALIAILFLSGIATGSALPAQDSQSVRTAAPEDLSSSGEVWVQKSPVEHARVGASVVLCCGANIRVYFIGGSADGKNVTNTVVSYDPVNEDWKLHATMPTMRYGAMAAVVNDKIYVIGGNDGNGYLSVVEQYDPATDNWVKNYSDIPTPRYGSGVAAIGGKIYLSGGAAEDNGIIPVKLLDDVQIFEPEGKSWSTGASMSSKRAAMASLMHGDKLYIFGGVEICGIIPQPCYQKTAEVFTPGGAWATLPELAEERAAPVVAVLKEKVYVIGGCRNGQDCDDVRADNEELALSGGGWTMKAPMPTARAGAGAAMIGQVIYVIGGAVGKIKDPTVMPSNELYDPDGIMAVQVQASKSAVYSGETVDLSVKVIGSGVSLAGAAVDLSSDRGGSFNPANGSTDPAGKFSSVFTAPLVSNDEMVTISVGASRSPYAPANGTVQITVRPPTLAAKVSAQPNTIFSKKTSAVSVSVTQGATPVADADVGFTAACGTLDAPSAKSGADGIATVTFTAPDVSSDTTCKIDAKATKTGFREGADTETITVIAGKPDLGLVSGVVTHGKTKLPLAGAKVEATSGGTKKDVLTGADGKYLLRDLPPGSYDVKVTLQDFAANSSKVEIRAGEASAQDFELWPSEGGATSSEDRDWWSSLPWWMKLLLMYVLPIMLASIIVALMVRRRRKNKLRKQQEILRQQQAESLQPVHGGWQPQSPGQWGQPSQQGEYYGGYESQAWPQQRSDAGYGGEPPAQSWQGQERPDDRPQW